MILGFHTAGLLLHDEPTAVTELARIGYAAVAVRPRRGGLDPADPDFPGRLRRLGEAVERSGLALVIDAEGRFVHDPRAGLGPSLVAAAEREASAARDWIRRWIDAGTQVGASLITFAAGVPPSPLTLSSEEQVLERLADQLDSLLSIAQDAAVSLALRPAAGQAVATVARFERLRHWLRRADELRLAADVGEMLLGGELPLADRLARNAGQLGCVYLCDRQTGQPQDAPIGRGDVDLRRLLRSLRELDFAGPAIIRVEGHSEAGLALAEEGWQQLSDSAGGAGRGV